jgi:uncharacterized protein (TIGR02186 family)
MRRAAAVLLGLMLWASSARAESLIISLSTHRFQIASNFVGAEIVLFGSVERDAQTIGRPGGYDLAVVVRGPKSTIVTRKKDRVLGLWVNRDSREFLEVPSTYALLSNRPAANLTSIDLRKRHQIGLEGLILLQRSEPGEDPAPADPFREALVRLNNQKGLYRENPTGVTFLTPTLFRANIPLSPNTPVGTFDVEIFLFSEGGILAREQTNFEITKVGFEAFVANSARDYGLFYGLSACLLALLTGWAASVVFRRD